MKKQFLLITAITLICLSKLASANQTPIQLTAYNITDKCSCTSTKKAMVCKKLPQGQQSVAVEFDYLSSIGIVSPQAEIKPDSSGVVSSTSIVDSSMRKIPVFAVRESGNTSFPHYTPISDLNIPSAANAIYVITYKSIPVVASAKWIDYDVNTQTGTCKYIGPIPPTNIQL